MILTAYKPIFLGFIGIVLSFGVVYAADFETADAEFQDLTSEQDKLAWVKKYEPEVTQWSKRDQAYYYHRKGMAFEVNGDIEGAKEQLKKSIQIFKSLDDLDSGLVRSLLDLGFMKYLQSNDPQTFCSEPLEALSLVRQLDVPDLLVETLIQLVLCYQSDLDDLSKGLALLEEATELVKTNNLSQENLILIYNTTGHLYRANQIHQQAYKYFLKAHHILSEFGERQDVFNMLHNLASESMILGHWDQAQSHIQNMFDMAKQYPDYSDFQFFAEYNAGWLAYTQQDFQKATTYFQAAMNFKDTTPEQYYVTKAEGLMAVSYFRLGKFEQAYQAANRYLGHFDDPNDKDVMKAVVVIDLFSQQNYTQGLQKFWTVLDKLQSNNRDFVNNAVALQAISFGESLDALQNRASQQQLTIKELELEQHQKQIRINQLTALVVSLFAVVLVIIAWLLYRSKKRHQSRAQTDYLTRIANRRHIMKEGHRLLALCQKKQQDMSIIIIDIDDFKPINDSYGHAVGDVVIKQVVESMRESLSDGHMLGRMGGEEFLMLLPNTNKVTAYRIAERVRQHVTDALISVDNVQFTITISLGLAINTPPVANFEQLLQHADEALYHAKAGGKNQVQPAYPMSASL